MKCPIFSESPTEVQIKEHIKYLKEISDNTSLIKQYPFIQDLINCDFIFACRYPVNNRGENIYMKRGLEEVIINLRGDEVRAAAGVLNPEDGITSFGELVLVPQESCIATFVALYEEKNNIKVPMHIAG